MTVYQRIIDNKIQEIYDHFYKVDDGGWPLDYYLQIPSFELYGETDDNMIAGEIEFIGKLLDISLNVVISIDGVKIVKLKGEYYV